MAGQFGNGAYYASRPGGEKAEPPTPLELELAYAIPDAERIVEDAYKRWNQVIRDHLRAETGLRLSQGEERTSVSVRVVAGLPAPAVEAFEVLGDPLQLWLVVNRSHLLAAQEGARLVDAAGEYPWWKDALASRSVADHGSATASEFLKLTERLLAEKTTSEFDTRLRMIESDVLGAYFFHKREVQLYWTVIGIVAAHLGVAVESLAIVVLAHELAHAYSHLGRDTDGSQWDTEDFAATDMHICEGLAQFYTHAVLTRLADRCPGAIEAFDRLLSIQSKPYCDWDGWTKGYARGREAVRSVLVELRSVEGRPMKLAAFLDALATAKGRLHVKQQASDLF